VPEPTLVKTPQDAAAPTRDLLAELGFDGVDMTGAGRDGGSTWRACPSWRKSSWKASRPMHLACSSWPGIASVEKKRAACLSPSGNPTAALTWAEHAGIAPFEFDYSLLTAPLSDHVPAVYGTDD
jgi:hypothetical protein